MTSEEFVRRIRRAVHDSAIDGTISWLEQPPGRRPSKVLVDLSGWYRSLAQDEQARVRQVVELAVRKAVFGMLTVLDGDRSIRESGEVPAVLELRLLGSDGSVLLNDQTCTALHDLFSEQVPLP